MINNPILGNEFDLVFVGWTKRFCALLLGKYQRTEKSLMENEDLLFMVWIVGWLVLGLYIHTSVLLTLAVSICSSCIAIWILQTVGIWPELQVFFMLMVLTKSLVFFSSLTKLWCYVIKDIFCAMMIVTPDFINFILNVFEKIF